MSTGQPVPIPESIPARRREKISLPRFFAYVLLVSALLTLLTCALSALFLRNIDALILRFPDALSLDDAAAEKLARIFAQLDTANLDVHDLVPAALSFVFTLGVGLLIRSGKDTGSYALFVVFAAVIALILFVLSLAASVWMTEVNDIRFGDLVVSLLRSIRAGALDSL